MRIPPVLIIISLLVITGLIAYVLLLRGKNNTLRRKIKDALHKRKGPKPIGEFRIVVQDRVGLLKDISIAIARSHVNIIALHADVSPGSRYPIDKIKVDVIDREKLERLALKLKNIKGVREVDWKVG